MHALRHSRRSAPLVFALALALWFASTLGMMHRVLHVETGHVPAFAAQQGGAPAHGEAYMHAGGDDHPHHHGGLLALFGDHADPDCRLYDQLAGGAAALSVPPVVLPIVLPTARFHYFLGEVLARWVALFDARGPPPTR